MRSLEEWENELLSTPLAGRTSGEDNEHTTEDQGFLPNSRGGCRCKRCLIIRIKRRRAFRFPRTKCPSCGELFSSIYKLCEACRNELK